MAKWISSEPPSFTGTQDGLTVYRLQGEQYYVRLQSSITGKRIKKDKAFAGFRESSSRMRVASRLASAVYRQFVVKEYPLYREMTGKAILWLKEGVPVSVIEERLRQAYLSKCAVNTAESRRSHASDMNESRLSHASSLIKIQVKGLFHIPRIFKTRFNKTKGTLLARFPYPEVSIHISSSAPFLAKSIPMYMLNNNSKGYMSRGHVREDWMFKLMPFCLIFGSALT